MAKKRDEERVYCEELRKQGKSYKEIQDTCEIKFGYKPSKGMCSHWLSDIELTQKQMEAIAKRSQHKSYASACKGAQTNKRKKQERIAETKAAIDYDFDESELKTAGLMLYWGEGNKKGCNVTISNSDPYAHRLFLDWLEQCYNIDKSEVVFYLQIHEGLDVEEAIQFWCSELTVDRTQFRKPYIKPKCNTNHRKNKLYMGTLQSRLGNTQLHYQIMFEIEEIKKHFSGSSK